MNPLKVLIGIITMIAIAAFIYGVKPDPLIGKRGNMVKQLQAQIGDLPPDMNKIDLDAPTTQGGVLENREYIIAIGCNSLMMSDLAGRYNDPGFDQTQMMNAITAVAYRLKVPQNQARQLLANFYNQADLTLDTDGRPAACVTTNFWFNRDGLLAKRHD